MEARCVVLPGEVDARRAVGGKARSLAALHTAGLPVPPWFVVLPEAFSASLGPGSAERLAAAATAAEAMAVVAGFVPTRAVAEEIAAALAGLGADDDFAVRSSALEEDSASLSFAGQLESFLHVSAAQVADHVARVWRSGFSERLIEYRRSRGLGAIAGIPAVIVQRMVAGEVSGVAFSADPVSGRRGIAVIAAVRGLADALVSGAATGETWWVDRAGRIVERRSGDPVASCAADARAANAAGVAVAPERATGAALLSEADVLEVAALARRAERLFGRPQDIEWTRARGTLWLLQSRPITTLAHRADPDAPTMLWDNANIVESYAGVTTPLTFSFARCAYENVYREFCRLMGVPEAVIEENRAMFAGMLGLVDGRVYYNLQNWYRMIALLPGYRANRRFLDQMLGVRGGAVEPPPARRDRGASLGDLARFALMVVTVGARLATRESRIARFYDRLHTALGSARPDLSTWRPDELVAHYRALERQLLVRWDAPVVNDFATMIHHGLLHRLATEWVGDTTGTLPNDLLVAERGVVSEDPARRVREMARLVAGDAALAQLLGEAEWPAVRSAMGRLPELARAVDDYLAHFGDRCAEELKLESIPLHDDPLPLLRAVGQCARALGRADAPTGGRGAALREAAEARVRTALARRPLRRVAFAWVLRNARSCVRARENLRFERTRVFGRARQIFVELGHRLAAVDRLDEPRDVFYLEQDELLGSVEGWATTADLRGLAAVRKAEYARYRSQPPPPDRFETCGFLTPDRIRSEAGVGTPPAGQGLQGQGCCAGVVRGPVRVVTDPRRASLRPGEIIVAERTDPGWVMLFPSASGLLVERGSLLSHSAIVARELDLPTIVAIDGLTHRLSDGDWVEMDGGSGRVTRLAPRTQERIDGPA